MSCPNTNQSETPKYTSVYDRVKELLVSQEYSDCSFSIENKYFNAHKLILAISSPVFGAMFYGPLATNDTVVITDINANIFELLLNFLYTDIVEIRSIDEAFELLYAAKKYMLGFLSEMCISYVQCHTNIENVIEILNYPEYLQDSQIIDSATNFFCKHARHLLQEKNIITKTGLKAVLESDYMNMTEKDLIKNVFEWSSFYCEQNNMPNTTKNRHDILKQNNLFELLRFSTLTVNEFKEIATDTNNVLYSHEIKKIEDYIKTKNDSDVIKSLCLIQKPRETLKLKWHFCHRIPVRPSFPFVIHSNNNIIQTKVRVNKAIVVKSLNIPTRMAPIETYCCNMSNLYSEKISVLIQNESGNDIIFTEFSQSLTYNAAAEITLKEQCLFKKNKWYKISFIWPSNITLSTYAVYMRSGYHVCNVWQKLSFEFLDLPVNSNTSSGFLEGLTFCY